ncbi:hypothetical protein [Desulfosporosinus youngiae]|uniref:DUF5659 domain-containing protein n=1 Tax=Desulfosporosinus youngiae DSM 17734 TaxID=768710 RepID=H5Y578_9FIRM|nr:hypothetical protein [Desulfosporosinus youngiae]EHQ90182.1 hypothetical protein DesyoDRAFT_3148 [Desulfosporosinus youngiae DSM 17734]
MEKLNYDNGDSNFVAYLAYLGYKGEAKVVENKYKKPHVIFSFEEDQEKFGHIYHEYKFDEVKLNLSKYSRFKDETFRRVKDTLRDYYQDKELR